MWVFFTNVLTSVLTSQYALTIIILLSLFFAGIFVRSLLHGLKQKRTFKMGENLLIESEPVLDANGQAQVAEEQGFAAVNKIYATAHAKNIIIQAETALLAEKTKAKTQANKDKINLLDAENKNKIELMGAESQIRINEMMAEARIKKELTHAPTKKAQTTSIDDNQLTLYGYASYRNSA